MKLDIGRISQLRTGEKSISVTAYFTESPTNTDVLAKTSGAALVTRSEFLPCTLGGLSLKPKPSVLLHFSKNLSMIVSLFPALDSSTPLTLMLEVQSDPLLFSETHSALMRVCDQEGLEAGSLLLDLTAFKPGIRGVPDLRFVSERQLRVLRDKLMERLNRIS